MHRQDLNLRPLRYERNELTGLLYGTEIVPVTQSGGITPAVYAKLLRSKLIVLFKVGRGYRGIR